DPNLNNTTNNFGDLPLPITNLVGKTYLFKVTIEKDNYLYKHHTYKVEKIMTNEEVISEFDPNYVSTDSLDNCFDPEHSIISDAPEGSPRRSFQSTESLDLTPLKRRGRLLIRTRLRLTRMTCSTRIKKEKVDESG
ncbi:hypothetical protein HID58_047332, partial [Brassica napus]